MLEISVARVVVLQRANAPQDLRDVLGGRDRQ